MQSRDRRIRLISRPNTGIVGALNDGLAISRGTFIARMDSDDISLPNRFAQQETFLRLHPEHVLVGSRVLIVDPDGDILREMGDAFSHEEIETGLLARQGQLVYHPSVMFRADAVQSVGGYRSEFPHVEDLDLFLRLSEIGKLANIREPLLMYREHFSKVGFVFKKQQEVAITAALEQAYQRRHLTATPPDPARSDDHFLSISDTCRKWAWWALAAGKTKTARKHALAAIWRTPFSPATWRLFACTIRGY
ncbi:MAG: glycosyltransferase [Planctomycetes bacterium]|nr:glycosyltransferase [Planctomycetota bacterium]